jgi:hypothetical protein
VALAWLALALHARHYLPFLSDDALISLRYARRLLDGHGLTWTDGRPVEGYSNLLWILLTAALGGLGVELVTAARALGFAGHAAAVLALVAAFPPGGAGGVLPAALGAAVLVLSVPVAVWTVGGLEQPLLAALLAAAVTLCMPLLAPGRTCVPPPAARTAGASLCLGLLCWTRPDGPLLAVVAAACVGWLRGARHHGLSTALRLAVLPAVFTGAQLAFRLATYGEWLPNTAYVKISLSHVYAWLGLLYVGRGLVYLSPLVPAVLLLGGLAALRPGAGARARRVRLAFLSTLAGVWCVYVALVGGDIFPAFRQLVPVAVLAAFGLAEAARWLAERPRPAAANAALVAAGAVLLALTFVHQSGHHQTRRARAERFEWRGQVVGLALKRGFAGQEPRVAVTAAGAIPYWSELPALDMLGLNDHYLARHRPDDFGQGDPAHELGDADYVLRRQPDLVVYHVGMRAMDLPFVRALHARPEFRERYQPVLFEGSDPFVHRFTAWVRRDSPRAGVRRDGDRVTVPAHLFVSGSDTPARLDDSGSFAVALSGIEPAVFHGLALRPGLWRLEASASWPLRVRVRPASGEDWAAGTPPLEFRLPPGAGAVDLELRAPPLIEASVREVSLDRIGD